MRRYKIVEFFLYFTLTIFTFGFLSLFPLSFIYPLALFVLGFSLRIFLSKNHPKEHIKKLNRFSMTKILYYIDQIIWGVKATFARYLLRLLMPYVLVVSITLILNSDAPTYLVFLGSLAFDISLITLGKFDYQHQ